MTNNRTILILTALAAIAVFAVIYIISKPAQPKLTEIQPIAIAAPKATPSAPAEPPVVSAISAEPAQPEQAAVEAPRFVVPPLNQSDAPIKEAMQNDPHYSAITNWLTNDEIVRKTIVAVDNLAKGNVVAKYRPLNFSNKVLVVEQRGEQTFLDRRNFNRYNSWVDGLTTIEPSHWANWIKRYQPILDQAFGELGYKDQSFNARLNQALDQIIAAPMITTDIELTRPSVYYKYADPKIEKLPGIQKLMIRMGPENTVKVQRFAEALKDQLAQ